MTNEEFNELKEGDKFYCTWNEDFEDTIYTITKVEVTGYSNNFLTAKWEGPIITHITLFHGTDFNHMDRLAPTPDEMMIGEGTYEL
jgi:hypothetical protein